MFQILKELNVQPSSEEDEEKPIGNQTRRTKSGVFHRSRFKLHCSDNGPDKSTTIVFVLNVYHHYFRRTFPGGPRKNPGENPVHYSCLERQHRINCS